MKRILAFASVALWLTGCGFFISLGSSPREVNRAHLRYLRVGIEKFRDSVGRLPDSLSEVCSLPSDDDCWFHRSVRLNDAWKRPLAYSLRGDEYEIRSRGADGKVGTKDDLAFDSFGERLLVSEAAGCYRVLTRPHELSWLENLRLVRQPMAVGVYPASPNPPEFRSARWEISQGLVVVRWQQEHGALTISARADGDTLRGVIQHHGLSWFSLLFGFSKPGKERFVASRSDCTEPSSAG